MLEEAVCMLGAWFVAMEVSETPEFNHLDGWVNIFDNIVSATTHPVYIYSYSSDQSPLVAFPSSESWSCVQLLEEKKNPQNFKFQFKHKNQTKNIWTYHWPLTLKEGGLQSLTVALLQTLTG